MFTSQSVAYFDRDQVVKYKHNLGEFASDIGCISNGSLDLKATGSETGSSLITGLSRQHDILHFYFKM